MARVLTLFVAGRLAAVTGLRAQEQPTLAPGAEVRIHVLPSVRFTGTLVEATADSLVPRPGDGDRMRSVPREQIARLEVRVPRTRGQGAVRGPGWGALLGGAGGALFGAATAGDCDFCFGVGETAAIGAVLFGGIGAATGAILGATRPGQRWEEVLGVGVALGSNEEGRVAIATTFAR